MRGRCPKPIYTEIEVKNNAEARAARGPRFNGFENDFATNLKPSASMLGHDGGSRKSWTAPGGASLSQADVKAPGADPGGLGADPGGFGAHGPSIEVGGGGPLIELEILRS